ncbi:hypothetical protein V6N11_045001 [Hibiscus sabdariffa]|uniref:Uncharacterized protein n=2 Tax=Hibiscus sabdariffa TaxID=183260 RepID=A0ABR2PUH0_9ROSI
MFVAGTDTSITTSEWMMAEILSHPNEMKKVQQEVRSVVGNKSKVDPEDVPKMEYLRCVVKETLRLHPPAVFIPRRTRATASGKLGGYDIPCNTEVLINAGKNQTNSSQRGLRKTPYIPFGMGRRGCPGMSFGVASVEYVMANLLYCFDWKLPAGETPEKVGMTELYGLVVSKKTPLHALVIPHSSSYRNHMYQI